MKIFNWAKRKVTGSGECYDTRHLQADGKSDGGKMLMGISEHLDERSILAIGTLGTQILIESGHEKEGEYWDYLRAEVVQLPPATIAENDGVLENQQDQSCSNNNNMFKELAIDNTVLRSSSTSQSPHSDKTYRSLSPSDNCKGRCPTTKKSLLRRLSNAFIPCTTSQVVKINETCEKNKFQTSNERIGVDNKSSSSSSNNSSSMKNIKPNGASPSGSSAWLQQKSRLPKLLKVFCKRKKSQVAPAPIGHSSKQYPTSYSENNEGSQTPKHEVDTQYHCYSTEDNIKIELDLVNKLYYEYHISHHDQDNQPSVNKNIPVLDDNINWLIKNAHEYWISTDDEYVVLEL